MERSFAGRPASQTSGAACSRRGPHDANADQAGGVGRPHSSDVHDSGAVREAMRAGTSDRARHGRRDGAITSRLLR